jgi:hypothetical protein
MVSLYFWTNRGWMGGSDGLFLSWESFARTHGLARGYLLFVKGKASQRLG